MSQDVRSGSINIGERHSNGQPNQAKVVFYRDHDVHAHPVEKKMGRWVADFNSKVARYCAEKPRYSELRPL